MKAFARKASRDGGKSDMKRALKIGGILLVVAILVGGGAFFLRQQSRPAQAEATAPTATASRGSIEETVSTTGNVLADRQATLAFETSGRIAEVLAEEGQPVQAGQLLARLDTTALEWQVARSQAALDTAQARLEQAQKPASEEDLASARAALDSARVSYEKVAAGPRAEDMASAQAALTSAIANYDKVKTGATEEELAATKAAVDSARAAVEQAQAKYDRVKKRSNAGMLPEALELQNATIELERAQANYDAQVNRPAASELAAAKAQVAQAEAQMAQLKEQPTSSELAATEAQVAQAEAQLAQLLERPNAEDVAVFQAQVEEAAVALAQAQSALDEAVLAAPFDGTLVSVEVQEGEWATPGAPAMVLAATEPLMLDVDVDEVDVALLAEGQSAHLSFDALKGLQEEKIVGEVAHIAPASTNVGGAVAYGVEISFNRGDLPVRLGMTADVDIVVASADDALLVPNRAITADRAADRYYVTRQRPDGAIERLEVRIGLRGENQTQILEGLNEGDRVVLPDISTVNDAFSGQGGPGFFGGNRDG
jgi:HlyD family secretion protein